MSAFWSPRRVLLAVALLASAALIFVVGAQYRATQNAAESMIQGQAERLMIEARSYFPLNENSVEDVLNGLHSQGLRYIEIDRPDGPIRAGEAQLQPAETPADYLRRGDRVRIERPMPPPHRHPSKTGPPPPRPPRAGGPRAGGPRAGGPRAGGPHAGGPPAPGLIVIEFEAIAWMELHTAALRQVVGGAFVLLALWIAFVLGWRALGRSAAQTRTIAKQKRLAMLGEMSATLAHEIRNPLTSLKGHAQLLLEDASDEKTMARSKRVIDEAMRLENLTSDLLKFLRSGEIVLSEEDPVALVRELCEQEPRVEVDASAAPALWPFDAARLRQALANLLDNALQAGDGAVQVSVASRGDALCFTVKDRGGGIDEAVRERMFEPFVTSRTRGTGLGLAMALRVAESHGGTITSDDREGGGTRFVLAIPRRKVQ